MPKEIEMSFVCVMCLLLDFLFQFSFNKEE